MQCLSPSGLLKQNTIHWMAQRDNNHLFLTALEAGGQVKTLGGVVRDLFLITDGRFYSSLSW